MAAGHGDVQDANLWQSILEASSRGPRARDSTVIVVGDRGGGARGLVRALRNTASGKKNHVQADVTSDEVGDDFVSYAASALRYVLVEKKDIFSDLDTEKYGQLHLWLLNDASHSDLLRFALKKEHIANTSIVFALDMSRPWTVQTSFNQWVTAVSSALDTLFATMDASDVNVLREAMETHIREFQPPLARTGTFDAGSSRPRTLRVVSSRPECDSRMPDEEWRAQQAAGVLSINLGVPVVVACCKSDRLATARSSGGGAISTLSEHQATYLQAFIRTMSIKYGAAVVYCSSITGTNMEALYAYLLQRTDPDRFLCLAPAEFVRLDAIFLPSGKDSFGFIADCGVSLDDTKFEDIIPAPSEEAKAEEEGATDTVIAIDETSFVAKVQELEATAATQVTSDESRREAKRVIKRESETTARRRDRGSVAQPTASGAASMDTASLNNFFQNLLSKGGGKGRSKGKKDPKSRKDRSNSSRSTRSSSKRVTRSSSKAKATAKPAS